MSDPFDADGFKRALRSALARLPAASVAEASAGFERITITVVRFGQEQTVEVRLLGGDLVATCSCGRTGCEHARAALRMLQTDSAPASAPPPPARPALIPGVPERRTLHPVPRPLAPDTGALAEVLQDLVTAVVRSGVREGASPSVEEALQRLEQTAPTPLPAGFARFAAGLSQALLQRNTAATARALAGASLLSADLLENPRSEPARRRKLTWLGAEGPEGAGLTQLSDVQLLEVAREQVGGPGRKTVERRYLVELKGGAVYCEERTAVGGASLGPCPRMLTVWLADLEETAPPHRIRLLQYTVGLAIEAAIWASVQKHACASFEALLERAREALRDAPGLGDPFVLVAPAAVAFETNPELHDAERRPLLLARPDNPAALRHFEAFASGGELRWVAGRLLEQAGVLALAPLSAAVLRHGRLCYAQI